MTASDAVLKELHGALARELLDIVANGVPVFKGEGEDMVETRRKATAAELSVAVAFLKANDITANLDDSDEARKLGELLEARRKKAKPVMPDMLDMH